MPDKLSDWLVQETDSRGWTMRELARRSSLSIATISDSIPTDPLIVGTKRDPLTTAGLLRLIKRLGERAGIPGAHPHRFRHTFAINFLRNGGKVFELQYLLGHTTLEMVQRYLKLSQVDLEEAHRRASPVTNWNL